MRASTAIIIIGCTVLNTVVAEERVTLDEVLKVWKERQEATKSLRFVIEDEYTTFKGFPLLRPDEIVTVLDKDTTHSQTTVLTIDGRKMRYERSGTQWFHVDFMPLTYIAVFDGATEKYIYMPPDQGGLRASGNIRDSQKHGDANNLSLSPVTTHFFPFGGYAYLKPEHLRLIRRDEVLGKVRTVVLEDTTSDANTRTQYWVAPEQGMSIVRRTSHWKEKLNSQIDVTFQKDDKHGWVPHHWRCEHYVPKLSTSSSCKVTKFELNAPVAPSTFDIEFPPGAEVFNQKLRKTFVVQPDGTQVERR